MDVDKLGKYICIVALVITGLGMGFSETAYKQLGAKLMVVGISLAVVGAIILMSVKKEKKDE